MSPRPVDLTVYKLTPDETARVVRQLRERLNATQTDFARLLDVQVWTVCRWETGKQRPHPRSWFRINELKVR